MKKPNIPIAQPVGKVLDLSRWMDQGKNRINRVGIELEGGWTIAHPGLQVHHDGSVFKGGIPKVPEAEKLLTAGEVSSPPIEPATMPVWVRKYHPQVVDYSCGLHIHMGFKSVLHYSRLMDSPDYQETLLDYLKQWGRDHHIPKEHCLWGRLDGQNKYCKKNFWPDLQAIKKGKEHNVDRDGGIVGNRYTVVNYCWGLGFETLEVRVLPMFDTPALSISALKCVMDVTNAYLAATAPRKLADRKKEKFTIKADNLEHDSVYREHRVVRV